MAVSIKDPGTDRLIRELARRTGDTQVGAVRTAVAERLERINRAGTDRQKPRKDRLKAIVEDTAPRLAHAPDSTAIGDLLYDERGLSA